MNRFLGSMRSRGGFCLSSLAVALALNGTPALPASPSPRSAPVETAPERLSLAEAQRIAFQRNWDLLAAKAGMDAAAAQLLVAKEFPNPTLSLSTVKIDPRGNSTPSGNGVWSRSYDTIFAVSQLLEIAGKRRDRQASARAGITG